MKRENGYRKSVGSARDNGASVLFDGTSLRQLIFRDPQALSQDEIDSAMIGLCSEGLGSRIIFEMAETPNPTVLIVAPQSLTSLPPSSLIKVLAMERPSLWRNVETQLDSTFQNCFAQKLALLSESAFYSTADCRTPF
jgi:hypothetical protein